VSNRNQFRETISCNARTVARKATLGEMSGAATGARPQKEIRHAPERTLVGRSMAFATDRDQLRRK
jgi:hypothetical protein